MKKYLLITLAASSLLVGCKKKGCTDAIAINYSAEAKKDDGSCKYTTNDPSNPIGNGILFSAHYNYIDRNQQFDVQAKNGFSIGDDTGAIIYSGDSVLLMTFIDDVSGRQFDLNLYTYGGNTISTGTYLFMENQPNYNVGITTFVNGTGPVDTFGCGYEDSTLTYHNVPTPRSGQFIITSISNNHIQGTVSGDFYGENDFGTLNFESKMVVTNGQFSCKLYHY